MKNISNLFLFLPFLLHQLVHFVSIPAAFQLVVVGVGGAVATSVENNVIELNPDHIEKDESDDDSDDDSDDEYDDDEEDEDDDEEEEESDSKSILNKALSTTSQKASKSIQLFQKHRTSITIAFAIFAFRREIYNALLYLFTIPTTETDANGNIVKKKRKFIVKFSPTAIMKIILFIDFMRKMQGGGSGSGSSDFQDGGKSSSIAGSGGLFGSILGDLLQPGNTAFIPPVEQHYTFEKVNHRFNKDGNAWKKITDTTDDDHDSTSITSDATTTTSKRLSSLFNRTLKETSTDKNQENSNKTKTAVILEMKLDSSVTSMSLIRDQISFILHQHRLNRKALLEKEENNTSNTTNTTTNESNQTFASSTNNSTISKQEEESKTLPQPELEIVILLESPGGSATDYGLISNLIQRLRKEPGIKLTICVDKVAASGGYMIACMASPNQLFASPFAVVGSIGVYGQTLNIHNTLQNWGVQPLVFRGGKDKAPVGLVGEITKEGIAKVQGMIDKTHIAFKKHVVNARPILKDTIDAIATGDVWLGYDALEVGLVDRILTSDEYIWDKIHNGEEVLKLMKFQKPRLGLFGSPKYGPGVPGVFHRMIQSMTETTNDVKVAFEKVNRILEEIPTPNNDFTKIVSARSSARLRTQTEIPKF